MLRYKFIPPNIPKKTSIRQYLATLFIDEVRALFKSGGLLKIDNNEETSNSFLVGYKKELFCISSDLQVIKPLDGCYCLGSGDEYAFGSLYSTKKFETKPRG